MRALSAFGDGLKDPTYSKFKDEGTPPQTFTATRRLDRHHRQILDGGRHPAAERALRRRVQRQDHPRRGQELSGGLSPGRAQRAPKARARRSRIACSPAPRSFDTIRNYEHSQGIARFDLAIDWGWFIIITQPIFWLLDQSFRLLGNFGLAILLLTVTVKLIFFPIANAQYKSMGKMKKVQPEMERIKERFKDDAPKQQQAMMELYKREKVNPVSGCLPMLLIIPVFFSLYKVINVTIEARQAPFYGWIHDLSVPDPTSIINLFGLLPFITCPICRHCSRSSRIGIWPILMGITQWLQTKLNPAPADPVQAQMFAFMPLIFTFMFANFAAGLVIYYTWNNLLSVAQQYVMMRRQGVEVHLVEQPEAARVAEWPVRTAQAADDKSK